MRNICLAPTVAKPFHKQVYDKVTTIRLQNKSLDDARIFLKVTQKKQKNPKKPSPRLRKVG